MHEILGFDRGQRGFEQKPVLLLGALVLLAGVFRALREAEYVAADAALDDLVEADERAAADEEDVRGVDVQVFLLRVPNCSGSAGWNS